MKKFLGNISLSSLNSALRRLMMENANGNFLWHIVLGFAFSVAVAIAIFAWLSYGEVTAERPVPSSSKRIPAVLSIDELREVIDFYQKKEEDFKILRSSPPSAPSLSGKGGGMNKQIDTNHEFDQSFLE